MANRLLHFNVFDYYSRDLHHWVILDILTAVQVCCLLYMRDGLVLTLLTILVHCDRLKTWQLAKLPPKLETQQYFISRLFRYGKKTN